MLISSVWYHCVNGSNHTDHHYIAILATAYKQTVLHFFSTHYQTWASLCVLHVCIFSLLVPGGQKRKRSGSQQPSPKRPKLQERSCTLCLTDLSMVSRIRIITAEDIAMWETIVKQQSRQHSHPVANVTFLPPHSILYIYCKYYCISCFFLVEHFHSGV